MTKETPQAQLTPLVNRLIELANEIDGIADFGMTVCIGDDEKMAGRHDYVTRRCEKVRRIVDSISSLVEVLNAPDLDRLFAAQSRLNAGSEMLLTAFVDLEHFRGQSADLIRSATNAVRTGWEAIHLSIKAIAESLNILDESWYFSIRERQDTYRAQLEHIGSAFIETAQHSNAQASSSNA